MHDEIEDRVGQCVDIDIDIVRAEQTPPRLVAEEHRGAHRARDAKGD